MCGYSRNMYKKKFIDILMLHLHAIFHLNRFQGDSKHVIVLSYVICKIYKQVCAKSFEFGSQHYYNLYFLSFNGRILGNFRSFFVILWSILGHFLVILWSYFGQFRSLFWPFYGRIFGQFLVNFWSLFGHFMGVFWAQIGRTS